MKRNIFLGMFLLISTSLFAQSTPRQGLVPFPAVFYSDETGLGGVLSFIYFDYGERPVRPTRPDTISAVVLYTEENQFLTALTYKNYFPRNQYLWTFSTSYSDFPKLYFGVGPDTSLDTSETYDPRSYSFETAFQKRFVSYIYAGVIYRYTNIAINDVEPGGMLENSDIIGLEGGDVSGAGVKVDYDSRNNSFSPGKGMFISFETLLFHEVMGSDFEYEEYQLDLRAYYSLPWRDIIAGQVFFQINNGDIPFQLLPEMGGQNLMRGIYKGRYRDKTYAAAQVEYRMLLGYRWAIVAFGGAGQVGKDFTDYTAANMEYAGGGGLRYYISRRKRIAYRVDVGFSKDDTGIYVNLLEAF